MCRGQQQSSEDLQRSDTQPHRLDYRPALQPGTVDSPGSLAGRGNWLLLLERYVCFLRPFLHRPALFLLCWGRLFAPSECRPPLHFSGQEAHVGLGCQRVPSPRLSHPSLQVQVIQVGLGYQRVPSAHLPHRCLQVQQVQLRLGCQRVPSPHLPHPCLQVQVGLAAHHDRLDLPCHLAHFVLAVTQ